MKFKSFALLALIALIFGCNNPNLDKQRELDLKEKELDLKEKELLLKQEDNNVLKDNSLVDSPEPELIEANQLSNIENILGNWFIPHAGMINIKFIRDGSFEFNDYNSNLGKEELLTGTFQLENGTLTLLYNDRPKQKFNFYKGTEGDSRFYIKGSNGYYFIKGENGDP